jgi:hypothetical protein
MIALLQSYANVDKTVIMKRRISHYQRVAEIAYETAKRFMPLYRHKNSPHRFTCQQVITLEFLSITLQNFLWSLYVSQGDTRLSFIALMNQAPNSRQFCF